MGTDPASGNNQDGEKGPSKPKQADTAGSEYGNLLAKIILGKFDSMPEWARIFAFLVAFLVIVYAFVHSLDAKYFVTGTVLKPSATQTGANEFARGYDVRWGDKYAGTSSKGAYVFVLSASEYFGLVGSGSHSLQVWQPGQPAGFADVEVCEESVEFLRLETRFDDYHIDQKCNSGGEGTKTTSIWNDSLPMFGETATVFAQTQATPFRLMVRVIKFSTQWPRSDTGTMVLFQNKDVFPLQREGGNQYGNVSILPGETFAFSPGVYLPAAALTGGRIKLSTEGALLKYRTYKEEWFSLPRDAGLGNENRLAGSLGSTLTIIPIGRSTITIFRKYGDNDLFTRLSEDMLRAGVLPVSAPSPMGEDKAINTLFIGSSVLPDTVKSVVAALLKNNISLKRIDYPYTFTSTSDTYRLQLGWSGKCDDKAIPFIPQQALANLTTVSSDGVMSYLQRYNTCK